MSTNKRGRPKIGNVLFQKRVSPEMALRLKEVLNGAPIRHVKPGYVSIPMVPSETEVEIKRLNGMLTAAVEQIMQKDAEIQRLIGEVENWKAMGLDEKGKLGWRMYYALKTSLDRSKGEFDQT